jgi:hypothetical protein
MFINRLARDAVVVASGLLMVAIVRTLGVQLGWLLVGVPSAALLPVFVIAGTTRSYGNAVVAIRVIQAIALVPVVVLLWKCWPCAIPQAFTSVLGFAALGSRGGDEARVAGSVAAASLVPTICALAVAPADPITLLLVGLFVSGLVWSQAARSKSSIPRAFVVGAA